jgi:hypothetical protein
MAQPSLLDEVAKENSSSDGTPTSTIPAPTPVTAPAPAAPGQPGYSLLDEVAKENPPANGTTPTAGTSPQNGQNNAGNDSVAQHGLLRRAWDFINSPIADLSVAGHRLLPEGVKTSDIIKAAAFEKMYGEAYIPGYNDFDTKAEAHLGPAPAKMTTKDGHPYVATPESHAFKNAVRTFIAGVAKDTSDMAAGFTSPVGIATTLAGIGPEAKAGSALAKAVPVAKALAGTAFGLKGASDIYQAGTENTPEAWQQRLQGGAMIAGGAASAGEGLRATPVTKAVAAPEVPTPGRLKPGYVSVADNDIPVRAEGPIAKAAETVVNPSRLRDFEVTKTQPAVRKTAANIAADVADTKAPTQVPGKADAFGFGQASDEVTTRAKAGFQKLDELSGGEFSKAQKEADLARSSLDFEGKKAYQAALDKQTALFEQHAREFPDEDLQQLRADWKQKSGLDELASRFNRSVGPTPPELTTAGEPDIGYVNPKQFRNSIIDAVQNGEFDKAGFAPEHVQALEDLGRILDKAQVSTGLNATLGSVAKYLGRRAVGSAVGGIVGGVPGAIVGAVAEHGAEYFAGKMLGGVMTDLPAVRALTAGLSGGAGPNIVGKTIANRLKTLWADEKGELRIPGTGPENPNSPASEAGNAPIFFSKGERVANQKVSTGSGDSILAALRNNGVKESEIQWLGLDDYLKGKPKVSKADLQQYINEHKIALNETNLGGNDWKHVRDLTVQRNKVYAENNRIWADYLRHAGDSDHLSSDLFNAMKEGKDLESVIAKMPADVQQQARRFVETDQQIRDLDKQINDAEKKVKPSKYESYTLPGDKDNYTEKLLTLPQSPEDIARKNEFEEADRARDAYLQAGKLVPGDVELRFQDAQTAMRKATGAKSPRTTFTSSHFEEPNVLAHTRFDDRTSLDGKKTLFLEELQSDWHQKGKQIGYQNPAPTTLPDGIYIVPNNGFFQVVNREGNPLLSRTWAKEADAKTAALEHYGEGAGNPGVPKAPFKSDWHELVIKRMLRHAAENGYDRLAWTTGDQQAARYDLSKHIGRVTYDPTDNTLQAFDPDGKNVLLETVEPTADAISEYIGKEPAHKLMEKVDAYKPAIEGEDEPDIPELKGLDLKVGGDWAKALYDRAIPNFLNKYAKKWGAKVGETELDTAPSGSLRYEIVDPKGNVQDAFRNRAGAEDAVKGYNEAHRGSGKWSVQDKGTTERVHSIEITPKMKKSVLTEGQPIAENQTPDWATALIGRAV